MFKDRKLVASVVLCVIFITSFVLTSIAFAADGDAVTTIINPSGTTIDMFDYYVHVGGKSSTNISWNKNTSQQEHPEGNKTGINKGHALKFWSWSEATEGDLNYWTENPDFPAEYQCGPYQGIVQSRLKDGYPVLNAGLNQGNEEESLSYLFKVAENPEDNYVDGRVAKEDFPGIKSYFTVDGDGYYLFDSATMDGRLNKATGEFSVTEQKDGQFFPFLEGSQAEENLYDPTRYSLGVHMQTDFSIPKDGMVPNISAVSLIDNPNISISEKAIL